MQSEFTVAAVQRHGRAYSNTSAQEHGNTKQTYLFHNLLEKFTAWTQTQQLDQCFLQRIAFYFEGGEKSSNAGWVQVLSDKLSKAAAELVGLKEPQSSGQAGSRETRVLILWAQQQQLQRFASSSSSPPITAQTHLHAHCA